MVANGRLKLPDVRLFLPSAATYQVFCATSGKLRKIPIPNKIPLNDMAVPSSFFSLFSKIKK